MCHTCTSSGVILTSDMTKSDLGMAGQIRLLAHRNDASLKAIAQNPHEILTRIDNLLRIAYAKF